MTDASEADELVDGDHTTIDGFDELHVTQETMDDLDRIADELGASNRHAALRYLICEYDA